MSHPLSLPPSSPFALNRAAFPWLIVLLGYAVMYAPVYWSASQSFWQSDDHGHGPLILAVVLWLFWTLRERLVALPARPMPMLGWPLFALGWLFYLLGRVFEISIFEMGSQIFIVAALLLLLRGPAALRLAWFPVFYLVFMVPLPGVFVDAITGPLKQWISQIVESLLYAVGYPIARSGVMMQIGQYQLLVADACSGLNSMFSLSALGTLFMYLVRRASVVHNVLMLLAILPIAFCANIVRVVILVLITYHLGDEAGQGFLHGAAGMVLMAVALLMFFLFDHVLTRIANVVRPARSPAP